ncbi:hypothetical protein FLGE108171_15680 [Flavobacterium gelidilacus]|uniref:hypothetical protein n=1 Tax=Flavobacterium gelidilacus TaxID=206041 RepID=UPI000427499C|nr:hypothetical protein [Flavobacterium gelidilacus]
MKKIILLLLIITTLSCCNKDDDTSKNPVNQLPPATQIGANKVGCLLDGQVFLPGNQPLSTNCFYQLVNGEYYFALALRKSDDQNILIGIDIGTNAKQIFQGETYNLLEFTTNNASAAYIYGTFENFTNDVYTGELTITKLDPVNQIVSGTFWFDVEDTNGIIHQIREGRFDMQYTQ